MIAQLITPGQQDLFQKIISGLRGLGYVNNLVQENYGFEDWFSARSARVSGFVRADAAAFGRLPLGHDNACFVIVIARDLTGSALISRFRSLGAPLAFEVTPSQVLLWPVRADDSSKVKPVAITSEHIEAVFASHADDWSPAAVLRAKNIIASPNRPQQLDMIDVGLIPALEEHIRFKLDPLLRRTFFAAMDTYKKRKAVQPEPGKLFRLVFRVLAGKVMTDRKIPEFRRFVESPDPDELLSAVNQHFGDKPSLIADAETRRVVVDRLWGAFSLENISAAVLSLIWENTLVDDKVRKAVGLYGTPISLARYMADRIGLDGIPEDERFVIEPCCGNGVFLLAAMKKMAALLDPIKYTNKQRHHYLKRMLSGFDTDPFGLEVARDCLMLADFPNSNGWVLEKDDVFQSPERSPVYHEKLCEARFVLCNPPFTPPFSEEERQVYHTNSVLKPAELLRRVINAAPNLAALGFVLPHQVLTGQRFRDIRRLLVERFGTIEVLSLPETGVFSKVEYKAVALIASEARKGGVASTLLHRTVLRSDWNNFVTNQTVTREERGIVTGDQASTSIAIPDLAEVWDYLRYHPTIRSAGQPLCRRGIQWNKPLEANRRSLIVDRDSPGYVLGIPSAPGKLFAFLRPPTKYLSVKREDRSQNAFDLPWDQPKVIMNANRKGRVHPWRIAAFPDYSGLIAYHTFKALWPTKDWSPELLAAVLNGPVVNAYVAAHETGPEITNEVLDVAPAPRLTQQKRAVVEALVREYIALANHIPVPTTEAQPEAERLLRNIDAAILQGYNLPPRLERKLLDYFNGFGGKRTVGFPVSDYFPIGFKPFLHLSEYLSEEFRGSTAGRLRANQSPAPNDLLDALQAAIEAHEE